MKVQIFHVDIAEAIESKKIRWRINDCTNQRQLWAKDCRVFAKDSVAVQAASTVDDICCVIAVTNEDLTSGEENNNFLYGAGNASAYSGCFSLFRYSPSFNGEKVKSEVEAEAIVLRRACKILTHELTHIFGLKHCINYHCLMNGVNHVQELDQQRVMECPYCTKKLLYCCGWDLKQRYRTWLEAALALGLTDLAQCIERAVLPTITDASESANDARVA
jgi:archaemetzincin